MLQLFANEQPLQTESRLGNQLVNSAEIRDETLRFFNENRGITATFYSNPADSFPLENVDHALHNGYAGPLENIIQSDIRRQTQVFPQRSFDDVQYPGQTLHLKMGQGRTADGRVQGYVATQNFSPSLIDQEFYSTSRSERIAEQQRAAAGGQRYWQQSYERMVVINDPQMLRDQRRVMDNLARGVARSEGDFLMNRDATFAMVQSIDRAAEGEDVFLASASVSDALVVTSLQRAAQRGANVTVITSNPLAENSFSFNNGEVISDLSRSGVRVITQTADDPLFIHTKELVTPEAAFVGSLNFSYNGRGHRSQDVMLRLSDPEAVAESRDTLASLAETYELVEYKSPYRDFNRTEQRMVDMGLFDHYYRPTSDFHARQQPLLATSMSSELFREFRRRGVALPQISMYRDAHTRDHGNEQGYDRSLAYAMLTHMDRTLATPSMGERFNRAVNADVIHANEGVAVSGARLIGRTIDSIIGTPEFRQRSEQPINTVRRYHTAAYGSSEDEPGHFEQLIGGITHSAQKIAVAVGAYIGLQLPISVAVASFLDTATSFSLQLSSAVVTTPGTSETLKGATRFYREVMFGSEWAHFLGKASQEANPSKAITGMIVDARRAVSESMAEYGLPPIDNVLQGGIVSAAPTEEFGESGVLGMIRSRRRYDRSMFDNHLRPFFEQMNPYAAGTDNYAQYVGALQGYADAIAPPSDPAQFDEWMKQHGAKGDHPYFMRVVDDQGQLRVSGVGLDYSRSIARKADDVARLLPANIMYWTPFSRKYLPDFDPKIHATLGSFFSFEAAYDVVDQVRRTALTLFNPVEYITNPRQAFAKSREYVGHLRGAFKQTEAVKASLLELDAVMSALPELSDLSPADLETAIQQMTSVEARGSIGGAMRDVRRQNRALSRMAQSMPSLTSQIHPNMRVKPSEIFFGSTTRGRFTRVAAAVGTGLLVDRVFEMMFLSPQGADLVTQIGAAAAGQEVDFTGRVAPLAALALASGAAVGAGYLFPRYETLARGAAVTSRFRAFDNYYAQAAKNNFAGMSSQVAKGLRQVNHLNTVVGRRAVGGMRFNSQAAVIGALMAPLLARGLSEGLVFAGRMIGRIPSAIRNVATLGRGEPFSEPLRPEATNAAVSMRIQAMVADVHDGRVESVDPVALALLSRMSRDMLHPPRPGMLPVYTVAQQTTSPIMQLPGLARLDSSTGMTMFSFGIQAPPMMGIGFTPFLPLGIRMGDRLADRSRYADEGIYARGFYPGTPEEEEAWIRNDRRKRGLENFLEDITLRNLAYMPGSAFESAALFAGGVSLFSAAAAFTGSYLHKPLLDAGVLGKGGFLNRYFDDLGVPFTADAFQTAGRSMQALGRFATAINSIAFTMPEKIYKASGYALRNYAISTAQFRMATYMREIHGITKADAAQKAMATAGLGTAIAKGAQNAFRKARPAMPFAFAFMLGMKMSDTSTGLYAQGDFEDAAYRMQSALGVGLLLGGTWLALDVFTDTTVMAGRAKAFRASRIAALKTLRSDSATALHKATARFTVARGQAAVASGVFQPHKTLNQRIVTEGVGGTQRIVSSATPNIAQSRVARGFMGFAATALIAKFLAHTVDHDVLYNIPVFGQGIRLLAGVERRRSVLDGLLGESSIRGASNQNGMRGFVADAFDMVNPARLASFLGMYKDDPDPYFSFLGPVGTTLKDSGDRLITRDYVQFSSPVSDLSMGTYNLLAGGLTSDDIVQRLATLSLSGENMTPEQMLRRLKGAPARRDPMKLSRIANSVIRQAGSSPGIARELRYRQFLAQQFANQRPYEHMINLHETMLRHGVTATQETVGHQRPNRFDPLAFLTDSTISLRVAITDEDRTNLDAMDTQELDRLDLERRMERDLGNRGIRTEDDTLMPGINPIGVLDGILNQIERIPVVGGVLGFLLPNFVRVTATLALGATIAVGLANLDAMIEFRQVVMDSRLVQRKNPLDTPRSFYGNTAGKKFVGVQDLRTGRNDVLDLPEEAFSVDLGLDETESQSKRLASNFIRAQQKARAGLGGWMRRSVGDRTLRLGILTDPANSLLKPEERLKQVMDHFDKVRSGSDGYMALKEEFGNKIEKYFFRDVVRGVDGTSVKGTSMFDTLYAKTGMSGSEWKHHILGEKQILDQTLDELRGITEEVIGNFPNESAEKIRGHIMARWERSPNFRRLVQVIDAPVTPSLSEKGFEERAGMSRNKAERLAAQQNVDDAFTSGRGSRSHSPREMLDDFLDLPGLGSRLRERTFRDRFMPLTAGQTTRRVLGMAMSVHGTMTFELPVFYQTAESLAVLSASSRTGQRYRAGRQLVDTGVQVGATLLISKAIGALAGTVGGLIGGAALGVFAIPLAVIAIAGLGMGAAHMGKAMPWFNNRVLNPLGQAYNMIANPLGRFIGTPFEATAAAADAIGLQFMSPAIRAAGQLTSGLFAPVRALSSRLVMPAFRAMGQFIADRHADSYDWNEWQRTLFGGMLPSTIMTGYYKPGRQTWYGSEPWGYGDPRTVADMAYEQDFFQAMSTEIEPRFLAAQLMGRSDGFMQEVTQQRFFSSQGVVGGRIWDSFSLRSNAQYFLPSNSLMIALSRRQHQFDTQILGARHVRVLEERARKRRQGLMLGIPVLAAYAVAGYGVHLLKRNYTLKQQAAKAAAVDAPTPMAGDVPRATFDRLATETGLANADVLDTSASMQAGVDAASGKLAVSPDFPRTVGAYDAISDAKVKRQAIFTLAHERAHQTRPDNLPTRSRLDLRDKLNAIDDPALRGQIGAATEESVRAFARERGIDTTRLGWENRLPPAEVAMIRNVRAEELRANLSALDVMKANGIDVDFLVGSERVGLTWVSEQYVNQSIVGRLFAAGRQQSLPTSTRSEAFRQMFLPKRNIQHIGRTLVNQVSRVREVGRLFDPLTVEEIAKLGGTGRNVFATLLDFGRDRVMDVEFAVGIRRLEQAGIGKAEIETVMQGFRDLASGAPGVQVFKALGVIEFDTREGINIAKSPSQLLDIEDVVERLGKFFGLDPSDLEAIKAASINSDRNYAAVSDLARTRTAKVLSRLPMASLEALEGSAEGVKSFGFFSNVNAFLGIKLAPFAEQAEQFINPHWYKLHAHYRSSISYAYTAAANVGAAVDEAGRHVGRFAQSLDLRLQRIGLSGGDLLNTTFTVLDTNFSAQDISAFRALSTNENSTREEFIKARTDLMSNLYVTAIGELTGSVTPGPVWGMIAAGLTAYLSKASIEVGPFKLIENDKNLRAMYERMADHDMKLLERGILPMSPIQNASALIKGHQAMPYVRQYLYEVASPLRNTLNTVSKQAQRLLVRAGLALLPVFEAVVGTLGLVIAPLIGIAAGVVKFATAVGNFGARLVAPAVRLATRLVTQAGQVATNAASKVGSFAARVASKNQQLLGGLGLTGALMGVAKLAHMAEQDQFGELTEGQRDLVRGGALVTNVALMNAMGAGYLMNRRRRAQGITTGFQSGTVARDMAVYGFGLRGAMVIDSFMKNGIDDIRTRVYTADLVFSLSFTFNDMSSNKAMAYSGLRSAVPAVASMFLVPAMVNIFGNEDLNVFQQVLGAAALGGTQIALIRAAQISDYGKLKTIMGAFHSRYMKPFQQAASEFGLAAKGWFSNLGDETRAFLKGINQDVHRLGRTLKNAPGWAARTAARAIENGPDWLRKGITWAHGAPGKAWQGIQRNATTAFKDLALVPQRFREIGSEIGKGVRAVGQFGQRVLNSAFVQKTARQVNRATQGAFSKLGNLAQDIGQGTRYMAASASWHLRHNASVAFKDIASSRFGQATARLGRSIASSYNHLVQTAGTTARNLLDDIGTGTRRAATSAWWDTRQGLTQIGKGIVHDIAAAGRDIARIPGHLGRHAKNLGNQLAHSWWDTKQSFTETGKGIAQAGRQAGRWLSNELASSWWETRQDFTQAGKGLARAGRGLGNWLGNQLTESWWETRQSFTQSGKGLASAGRAAGRFGRNLGNQLAHSWWGTKQSFSESGKDIARAGRWLGNELVTSWWETRQDFTQVGKRLASAGRATARFGRNIGNQLAHSWWDTKQSFTQTGKGLARAGRSFGGWLGNEVASSWWETRQDFTQVGKGLASAGRGLSRAGRQVSNKAASAWWQLRQNSSVAFKDLAASRGGRAVAGFYRSASYDIAAAGRDIARIPGHLGRHAKGIGNQLAHSWWDTKQSFAESGKGIARVSGQLGRSLGNQLSKSWWDTKQSFTESGKGLARAARQTGSWLGNELATSWWETRQDFAQAGKGLASFGKGAARFGKNLGNQIAHSWWDTKQSFTESGKGIARAGRSFGGWLGNELASSWWETRQDFTQVGKGLASAGRSVSRLGRSLSNQFAESWWDTRQSFTETGKGIAQAGRSIGRSLGNQFAESWWETRQSFTETGKGIGRLYRAAEHQAGRVNTAVRGALKHLPTARYTGAAAFAAGAGYGAYRLSQADSFEDYAVGGAALAAGAIGAVAMAAPQQTGRFFRGMPNNRYLKGAGIGLGLAAYVHQFDNMDNTTRAQLGAGLGSMAIAEALSYSSVQQRAFQLLGPDAGAQLLVKGGFAGASDLVGGVMDIGSAVQGVGMMLGAENTLEYQAGGALAHGSVASLFASAGAMMAGGGGFGSLVGTVVGQNIFGGLGAASARRRYRYREHMNDADLVVNESRNMIRTAQTSFESSRLITTGLRGGRGALIGTLAALVGSSIAINQDKDLSDSLGIFKLRIGEYEHNVTSLEATAVTALAARAVPGIGRGARAAGASFFHMSRSASRMPGMAGVLGRAGTGTGRAIHGFGRAVRRAPGKAAAEFGEAIAQGGGRLLDASQGLSPMERILSVAGSSDNARDMLRTAQNPEFQKLLGSLDDLDGLAANPEMFDKVIKALAQIKALRVFKQGGGFVSSFMQGAGGAFRGLSRLATPAMGAFDTYRFFRGGAMMDNATSNAQLEAGMQSQAGGLGGAASLALGFVNPLLGIGASFAFESMSEEHSENLARRARATSLEGRDLREAGDVGTGIGGLLGMAAAGIGLFALGAITAGSGGTATPITAPMALGILGTGAFGGAYAGRHHTMSRRINEQGAVDLQMRQASDPLYRAIADRTPVVNTSPAGVYGHVPYARTPQARRPSRGEIQRQSVRDAQQRRNEGQLLRQNREQEQQAQRRSLAEAYLQDPAAVQQQIGNRDLSVRQQNRQMNVVRREANEILRQQRIDSGEVKTDEQLLSQPALLDLPIEQQQVLRQEAIDRNSGRPEQPGLLGMLGNAVFGAPAAAATLDSHSVLNEAGHSQPGRALRQEPLKQDDETLRRETRRTINRRRESLGYIFDNSPLGLGDDERDENENSLIESKTTADLAEGNGFQRLIGRAMEGARGLLDQAGNALQNFGKQTQEMFGELLGGRQREQRRVQQQRREQANQLGASGTTSTYYVGDNTGISLATLESTAQSLGLSTVEWGAIISQESNFQPNVAGGDGGNYFGLIQWGEWERENELPALMQAVGLEGNEDIRTIDANTQLILAAEWMKLRGFTPGVHNHQQAYATILGGSPTATGLDSNGTMAGANAAIAEGGAHWNNAENYIASLRDDRQNAQRVGGGAGAAGGGSAQTNAIIANATPYIESGYRPGIAAQCAEFVREVYAESGIELGITAQSLDGYATPGRSLAASLIGEDMGQVIHDKDQLRQGDIVAWGGTYGGWGADTITHVGIYAGDGMVIDRSTSDGTVHHRSIDTFTHFYAAVRPHQLEDGAEILVHDQSTQQPERDLQVSSNPPTHENTRLGDGYREAASPPKPPEVPREQQPGEQLSMPQGIIEGAPRLGQGFEAVNAIAPELMSRDSRFNSETGQGRAALALAMAIGGLEVYGKDSAVPSTQEMFSVAGGTGSAMRGFGQYNTAYWDAETATPEAYTATMADMLTGNRNLPNSASGGNIANSLNEEVLSGQVQNGEDLHNFMIASGLGGSNWQAVDDGWDRVGDMGDQLVNYLRGQATETSLNRYDSGDAQSGNAPAHLRVIESGLKASDRVSISFGNIEQQDRLSLFEAAAAGYTNQNRVMRLASGETWDPLASPEERLAFMNAAQDEETGVISFSVNRRGREGTDGGSIMMPTINGGEVVYGEGDDGYHARLYDADGNLVMEIGGGEVTGDLPAGFSFASSGDGGSSLVPQMTRNVDRLNQVRTPTTRTLSAEMQEFGRDQSARVQAMHDRQGQSSNNPASRGSTRSGQVISEQNRPAGQGSGQILRGTNISGMLSNLSARATAAAPVAEESVYLEDVVAATTGVVQLANEEIAAAYARRPTHARVNRPAEQNPTADTAALPAAPQTTPVVRFDAARGTYQRPNDPMLDDSRETGRSASEMAVAETALR